MGLQPESTLTIKDFPGLVLRTDPREVDPGTAVKQINLTSNQVGELRSRAGYRYVKFED